MNDTRDYLRRSYKSAVMDLICAKDENEQFEAKKQMLKLEQLGGQSYGFDFMDELHNLYTSKIQEMGPGTETDDEVIKFTQAEVNAVGKVVEVMESVNNSLESKDILQELNKKQMDVADLREESNSKGRKCDSLKDDIERLEAELIKEKNCTEDFIAKRDAELEHLKEDLKKYSGLFPKVKSPVQKEMIKNEIDKLQAQEVPKPDRIKISAMEMDLKNKRGQLSIAQPMYTKAIKDFERAEKVLFDFERTNSKAIELAKNFLHIPRKQRG